MLFLIPTIFIGLIGCSDVELDMDVAQVIEHNYYPVEKHYVPTEDGYINQIQRIPYGRDNRTIDGCDVKKRPVIFLMHGLFANSFEYIMNLPSQSPAYIFADAGFDVWLGNIRGSRYGLNHTNLSHNSPSFWNFSIYEHSHHDLRSQIDYVLNKTNQKSLFYVGHSQGSAIMFLRLAEADEEWQSKIRSFFALGPTAGFSTPFYPFRLLEIKDIQKLIQFILDGKFGTIRIGIPKILQQILSKSCSGSFVNQICAKIFYLTSGFEKLTQFNESRIPIILSHFPDFTSTRNLLHWTQVFKYHELRKFDYGRHKNQIEYGSAEPPKFDIKNIVAPTYLYFSRDDKITDARDIRNVIIKHMGPGLREYYDLDHFTHFDYAIGLRANDEVFKPIIYTMYNDIWNNQC